jgi:hypothetical protein
LRNSYSGGMTTSPTAALAANNAKDRRFVAVGLRYKDVTGKPFAIFSSYL